MSGDVSRWPIVSEAYQAGSRLKWDPAQRYWTASSHDSEVLEARLKTNGESSIISFGQIQIHPKKWDQNYNY